MNSHCHMLKDPAEYRERMTKDWTPLAHHNMAFLGSILLAACRHLAAVHQNQEYFKQLAIHYKLSSVRFLSEAISTAIQSVSDATIATVLMLAFDEVRDMKLIW